MKKEIVIGVVLSILFLFDIRMVQADGDENEYPLLCGEKTQKFVQTGTVRQIDPIGGVIVGDVTTSDGPGGTIKNVVVIGQDEEEEGIGITVPLSAVQGDIVHTSWVTRCNCYAEEKESKVEDCAPGGDPVQGGPPYCYKEATCESIRTPGAMRHITDVRIWLEPSQDTADWLGWTDSQTDRTNLRWIYPEKWMVGTWTGDGSTTAGTASLHFSESYYKEWLAQQQGYNFLQADVWSVDRLWSVTMVEVANPVEGGPQSLGVFGNFTLTGQTYPMPNDFTSGSQWRVDYWVMNLYTEKHRATSDPIAREYWDPDTTSVLIKMEHLPLDLPGHWFIGIEVEMTPATVYYYPETNPLVGLKRQEQWGYGDSHWFSMADIDYAIDIHSFYSYILLSTPCNPLEENNCIDNSI
jgi:hypothetical protein